MKYSKLVGKTLKTQKEYETKNATLLTQAGFINQLMAGSYSMLPLGLRVLRKIENIIREEMNDIGGQEVLMPMLHPAKNWKKTSGWDTIDVLFKLKSRSDRNYALAQSAEEVVTPLMMESTFSYKELPFAVYQIQNKYRDELRAKSGILRGREFGMKDMYSFHLDHTDFLDFYETVKQAYLRVFNRVGMITKVTEASGGSFSDKISYEFMILTDAGEDDILYCPECNFCINTEIAEDLKKGSMCKKCKTEKLVIGTASEVGNVFDLGQKYSKDFDMKFVDEEGKEVYPFMGCYGIGTTRLMGVIVEKENDKNGIIWPITVAPYQVHLLSLGESKNVSKEADELYNKLQKNGIEVLYDERKDVSAGEKFADSDLIGIPIRVVISNRSLKENGFGLKIRSSEEEEVFPIKKAIKIIRDNIRKLEEDLKV